VLDNLLNQFNFWATKGKVAAWRDKVPPRPSWAGTWGRLLRYQEVRDRVTASGHA
jgi:hypothetical protein